MNGLQLEGVGVRIANQDILHAIDLTLASGEHLALLGPNGCGKTSLLRAILQLLPVHSGTVLFDGLRLSEMSASERARRIAYLPQGAQAHWPLPVARIVALGLTAAAQSSAAVATRVDKALAQVGASHLVDRAVSELSGGERTLVHLARVLIGEPAVILADEPVANLDPEHQLQVMQVLSDYAAAGAIVITVLHDLTLASRFCTRAMLLTGGELLADGSPDSTLTSELLSRTYGVDILRGEHAGETWLIPWSRTPDK